MYKKGRGHIFMICMTILMTLSGSSLHLCAQPRSIGAGISYNGLSVSYEHEFKDKTFLNVAVKAECAELFSERSSYPGISGSVTWNYVIRQWMSAEGNTISFFAGPGITLGYGKDIRTSDGIFFGIKGRIGAECSFARNITISASVAPAIGSHIVIGGSHSSMKYYKSGLLHDIIPEIGIKYKF